MRRFTLLDEVYFDALGRVEEALAREGIPHCLVGGGAAQTWIASLRTGDGARQLADDPVLKTALRRTRDLDFSARADDGAMLAVLNGLAAECRSGAHVMGPRLLRLGPVSVSFTLGPEGLSGMAEHYDTFLESRTARRIRRGNSITEVAVIGLEALLVTKLTRRGDKAKDILDLTQLVAALRQSGQPVDLAAVRVAVMDHPEALGLLEEIAQLMREEDG